MLSRWFDKSRALDDKDVNVRLQFLANLDAEKAAPLQERLLALVQRETDARVREAALAHVHSLDDLASLLERSGELPGIVADHIASHRQPDTAFCARHPQVARSRLLYAESVAEWNVLLPLFSGTEQLTELALKARGALREHLLAHPDMNREDAFTVIERLSRGRDKSINRHARERMEAIRELDGALALLRDRARVIDSTVAGIAAAADAGPAAMETRRRQLLALRQELDDLAHREAQACNQFTALGASRESCITSRCFDGLDLAPPARSPYTDLLEALPPPASFAAGSSFEDSLSQARAALASLEHNWQELTALVQPEAADVRARASAEAALAAVIAPLERWQAMTWPELPALPEALPAEPDAAFWSQLDSAARSVAAHARAETRLAWPADFPEPEALTGARAMRAQLEQQLTALRDEEQAILAGAEDLARGAAQAFDSGQTRQGGASLADARRALARVSGRNGAKLRQRLDSLSHRLTELKDWQTFATSPKREELLETMRALIGVSLPPEELADRIRHVRGEWNALGAPANRHEHTLRSAFEEAAQQAFEPCRAHYAEQDRQRAGNLRQRESLTAMLGDYLGATDWTQADYKAAEQILQRARQEWRAAFPLPKGNHKALVSRFEALQQQLHDHIHAHYQANSDRKQQLIDSLVALRESGAPVVEQVEQAKTLQARWKSIGPGLRHLEQKLWQAFRQTCDAIFSERQSEADAFHAERRTRLSEAEAVNAEFQQTLATLTAAGASPRLARDFRDRFHALGDLGREGHAIVDTHRRLLREFDSRLADFARQQVREQLAAIRRLDGCIDNPDTDLSAEDSRTLAYFRDRTPLGSNAVDTLRNLTLLAEIMAEVESAPEDRAARMALQVDMINSRSVRPDRQALLERWCSASDKPSNTDVEQLRERFFSAIDRLN
ncbi:MAG: DUF349 domain-containing protein [Pseudomonadales bacterium]|nr:DUF349 domain-containing protein [Pseudomonadales bacterium]